MAVDRVERLRGVEQLLELRLLLARRRVLACPLCPLDRLGHLDLQRLEDVVLTFVPPFLLLDIAPPVSNLLNPLAG